MNKSRPDRVVFFIDRSVGKRGREAIDRAAQNLDEKALAEGVGKPVNVTPSFSTIAKESRFAPDEKDEVWLAEAGRKGWIVVTRDKQIRHRQNELRAIKATGVVAFVLTAVNITGAELAEMLFKYAPKMARKAREAKPPAVFAVSRGGEIKQLALPSHDVDGSDSSAAS